MTTLTLRGLDGTHLWGFLTALGSLSLIDQHAVRNGHSVPHLAFNQDGTALLQCCVSQQALATVLLGELLHLKSYLDGALQRIDKPSDFDRQNFETIARESNSKGNLDFLASLAAVIDTKTTESSLCAANGASHQRLILSMRDILNLVEEEHLRLALFQPWTKSYRVPDDKRRALGLGSRKPTLRLDPSDERLYAYRFSNPTTTDDFQTELGAQALAIPAYALLPVVPSRQPVTIVSRRRGVRVTSSWPLWRIPATLLTIRSLLWTGVDHRSELEERGVFAAFCASRFPSENGQLSFSPSQRLW